MKRFIAVLQLLTTIPSPIDTGIDNEIHKGIKYFPLVGFILGLIYYTLSHFLIDFIELPILSVIIVVSHIFLTGALHLDGLADSFDGLYSYRSKDRILEIMKDSRIGTNGAVSLIVVIILKVILVYYVLKNVNTSALLIMPVIGRYAQVIVCFKSKPAREGGMGAVFIGKVRTVDFLTAGLITFIVILLSFFIENRYSTMYYLSFIPFLFVFIFLYKRHVYRKIDGLTGDILGAVCELTEVLFLMFAAADSFNIVHFLFRFLPF